MSEERWVGGLKDEHIEAVVASVRSEMLAARTANLPVSFEMERGFTRFGADDDGVPNNTLTIRIEVNGGAKDDGMTAAVSVAEVVLAK